MNEKYFIVDDDYVVKEVSGDTPYCWSAPDLKHAILKRAKDIPVDNIKTKFLLANIYTNKDMDDAYDKGWQDGARVGANSIAEKM